jgi:hypothetical protein
MSLNKKPFTIGKLREIIRELIKRNLEEASATSNIDGGEGPPKTPFAFSGKRKKDKKKEKEVATNSTGFKVVKEGKYHSYRNDDTLTPRQKIGRSMREVRNKLVELEKVVGMSLRLKNELNVDSRSYWKNTHKALQKISGRLVKLSSKVGEMK